MLQGLRGKVGLPATGVDPKKLPRAPRALGVCLDFGSAATDRRSRSGESSQDACASAAGQGAGRLLPAAKHVKSQDQGLECWQKAASPFDAPECPLRLACCDIAVTAGLWSGGCVAGVQLGLEEWCSPPYGLAPCAFRAASESQEISQVWLEESSTDEREKERKSGVAAVAGGQRALLSWIVLHEGAQQPPV